MRALKTKLRRNQQQPAAALGAGAASDDARYTNLIVQLKDLENLNRVHAHYIDWLRHGTGLIRLPTLFSEIFDIPVSSKSSTSSDAHSLLACEPDSAENEPEPGDEGEPEEEQLRQVEDDEERARACERDQAGQLQRELADEQSEQEAFFRLAATFTTGDDLEDFKIDAVEQL